MRDVLYDDPLQDMVASGSVGPHTARLWVRSGRAGRLQVRWWDEADPRSLSESTITIEEGGPTDQTASLLLPAGGGPLVPLRRYRYRVVHEATDHLVGEGAFVTAPESPAEMPRRFAIALWSCHQPFDEQGHVREEARSMLRAARKCLVENDVRMLFMVGDQMYSDFPQPFSLFREQWFRQVAPPGRPSIHDCTTSEVRRLYHERYRAFWGQEEWKALQAAVPTYPILDDHDIVDNWGSVPEHGGPRWASVIEGARWAYADYQAGRVQAPPGRVLPESFHYEVVYGNCAIFVMDLRSTRMAWNNQRLYSPRQESDLLAFLARHADKGALFIVLSVPVVHVPRSMAKVVTRLSEEAEDFSDRWSSPAHVHDRDHLLRIIHDHQREHPAQRLVLLSGDIHVACAHELRWRDGTPPLHQLVASPITHRTPIQIRAASKALILANRHLTTDDGALSMDVHLLGKAASHMHNPYAKRNLALVEVETPDPGSPPVLRFSLYGNDDGEPVCVYRSPPLGQPA